MGHFGAKLGRHDSAASELGCDLAICSLRGLLRCLVQAPAFSGKGFHARGSFVIS